jgi:hypothetical protein
MKSHTILTAFLLCLCFFVDANRHSDNEIYKPALMITAQAENGSFRQQVNKDGTITCIIKHTDVIRVNSIFFNGSDVTYKLVDNKYTTPVLTENSTLTICFDSINIELYTEYNTIAMLTK